MLLIRRIQTTIASSNSNGASLSYTYDELNLAETRAPSFCRIELSLLDSFKLGQVTQCPQFPFDTLALAKTG